MTTIMTKDAFIDYLKSKYIPRLKKLIKDDHDFFDTHIDLSEADVVNWEDAQNEALRADGRAEGREEVVSELELLLKKIDC